MFKIFNKLVLLTGASMLAVVSAEATAVFARQYDLKCSACHIGVPPALNSMGQSFYRNGFKFSNDDKTMVDKVKAGELIPLSIMIGARARGGTSDMVIAKGPKAGKTVHKSSDFIEPTFKMMTAGSINKNLSFFIGAKWAYMDEGKKNSDDKSINLEGRKGYLMYNTDDLKHAVRVGSISPYAQLGNIKRSVEGSGINAKVHKTPLVRAHVDYRTFGGDYTYRDASGYGLLLAAGSVTEDVNHLVDNDRMNYIVGLDYYNADDLRVSFIVNHTASSNDEAYSSDLDNTVYMVPVEYSMNNEIFINTALVYEPKNTSAKTSEYYGVEAAASYAFMENTHVRLIASYDNDSSSTYSVKYSQIFRDNLFLTAQVTQTNSEAPAPLNPKNKQAMFSSAEASSYVLSLNYVY